MIITGVTCKGETATAHMASISFLNLTVAGPSSFTLPRRLADSSVPLSGDFRMTSSGDFAQQKPIALVFPFAPRLDHFFLM